MLRYFFAISLSFLASWSFAMDVKEYNSKDKWGNDLGKSFLVFVDVIDDYDDNVGGAIFLSKEGEREPYMALHIKASISLPSLSKVKITYRNDEGKMKTAEVFFVSDNDSTTIAIPDDYESGLIEVKEAAKDSEDWQLVADVTPPEDFSRKELESYKSKL
jgi:hypothetical protein